MTARPNTPRFYQYGNKNWTATGLADGIEDGMMVRTVEETTRGIKNQGV